MTDDAPHDAYSITLHMPHGSFEVPGTMHPTAIPRKGEEVQLTETGGHEAGEWVVAQVCWNVHLGGGVSRNVGLFLDPW